MNLNVMAWYDWSTGHYQGRKKKYFYFCLIPKIDRIMKEKKNYFINITMEGLIPYLILRLIWF
jgi:hypothetical protein